MIALLFMLGLALQYIGLRMIAVEIIELRRATEKLFALTVEELL